MHWIDSDYNHYMYCSKLDFMFSLQIVDDYLLIQEELVFTARAMLALQALY